MFYNFGTTQDIKLKLLRVSTPDNVFGQIDIARFAGMIRGEQSPEEVGAAIKVEESFRKKRLMPMERYQLIEALCDNNEFVYAVVLKQYTAYDQNTKDESASIAWLYPFFGVMIVAYLVWAIGTMATFFYKPDQVLSVLSPIVYTGGVFTILFLFPLWIMVGFTKQMMTLILGVGSYEKNTILPDHEHMMQKIENAEKNARRSEAMYQKWALQYKVDTKRFLSKAFTVVCLGLSPVLVLVAIFGFIATRSNNDLWLLIIPVMLLFGAAPSVIVRRIEKKIKIRLASN